MQKNRALVLLDVGGHPQRMRARNAEYVNWLRQRLGQKRDNLAAGRLEPEFRRFEICRRTVVEVNVELPAVSASHVLSFHKKHRRHEDVVGRLTLRKSAARCEQDAEHSEES